MDREAEQAPQGKHKSVVILSDRSREIIRLFEERQRQRQQREQNGRPSFTPVSSESR